MAVTKLAKLAGYANIAEKLDDAELSQIGYRVVEEFDIDKESRSDWEDRNEVAMKLATQVIEMKNWPFEGAANIKYPTLSIAAVQFSARAYPQIVQGQNVVKGKVIGSDPDGTKASRADRIGVHMSYQLLEEMEEWEDDTDSLLTALPIEGCEFKKTYFSPEKQRNVSEWVRPNDLVVHYRAKSLETAPRATHVVWYYPNEIIELVRSGTWLDEEAYQGRAQPDMEKEHDARDVDAPHCFYEQHRWLDLDDDGYKEPYIVTVHRDTRKVARIKARYTIDSIHINEKKQVRKIDAVHYFTQYKFMPSPDGGFYGMGFGTLLTPINESINMTLNQLHDSGTLSNTQGGFIGKGMSIKKGGGGEISFKMGQFEQVGYTGDDIKKAIMPLPFKEPSLVLFNLLGLLIDAGDKLGSVTDPLMGEAPGANVPATTTLALIEQGLKVFSSVFKRIHRSLGKEFKKLYRLNSVYLEDEVYFTVLDSPKAVGRMDYNMQDVDVAPVSDPSMVSDTQQLIKAQALMGMLGAGFNDDAIKDFFLESLRVPDREKFKADPNAKPTPEPKIMLELQKLELERDKFELEIAKAEFEIVKMKADAIKSLAQAEAAKAGPQLEQYKADLQSLTERYKAQQQARSKQLQSKQTSSQAGESTQ